MTINTVKKDVEIASLPATQTASGNLEELTTQVNEIAGEYWELCAQQKTLTTENEGKFLAAVLKFSAKEYATNQLGEKTLKTTSSLDQTAQKVHQQLSRLRVPTFQPPAKPTPCQLPPSVTVTQNSVSQCSDVDHAEKALAAFKKHIANPPSNDTEKYSLAEEMVDAFEKVKSSNDPRLVPLRKEKYVLLQQAFAPKIPEEVQEMFMKELLVIQNNVAKLPTKCETLEEYVAAQREEDKVIEEIAAFKRRTVEELAKHSITLDANNLQLKYLGQEIDTDLTKQLNEVTIPFSKNQEKREANQLAHIQQNYTATDQGGGGDCLFRSFAGSMGLDPDTLYSFYPKPCPIHLFLRETLIETMKNNRARYEPLIRARLNGEDRWVKERVQRHPGNDDFERYIHAMRTQGTWGGQPEIQAMADFLGRPVAIVQERFGIAKTNTTEPKKLANREPLVIKNLGDTHFQSMIPNPTVSRV